MASKLPFILICKLWKTSASGSHNLFWIKTYKLVFLCKIVVDTYHEWENIFQLWERELIKGVKWVNKNCSFKIFFSDLIKESPHFIIVEINFQNKKMWNSKRVLVFGDQFPWEIIGTNFSTSEIVIIPKLLYGWFFILI